jgi:hypothetical protein
LPSRPVSRELHGRAVDFNDPAAQTGAASNEICTLDWKPSFGEGVSALLIKHSFPFISFLSG